MGFLGQTALKLFQTAFYAITFAASAIILGIYSYFLWWLDHENRHIPTWEKAVEGLSGASCLYLIFAVLLTCFLGGKPFFAFLAIVFNLLFMGAMIAIAVMTRHGTGSCSSNKILNTPLGTGLGSINLPDGPHLHYVCTLNKACFAVSIIAAVFFLFLALIQLFLGRNHQKEKRYGPGPNNGYTAGSGRRGFFNRRRGAGTTRDAYAKDAEVGAVAGGGLAAPAVAHDVRPSHDTGYTGSTVGNGNTYVNDKYQTGPYNQAPTGGNYHASPATANTANGVNPYGYDTANTNTTRMSNF